jgi:hypothetical protein
VPEITTAVSLAAIAVVLAITTVASLIKSRRDQAARAHAGAILGTPSHGVSGQHRHSDVRQGRTTSEAPHDTSE